MKWFSRITSFLFLVVLLLGSYLTVKNFRNIGDYIAFRTATPGSVAEQYSKTLNLTDQATNVLYGAHPQVDEKIQFNANCKPGKNVTEFGCYISGVNKIYVLNINDTDLKSMTSVAMAHELLHAEYDRLNQTDKKSINSLLEQQLANTNDPDLTARLKVYAQTEPGNQDNELHSIFATEYQKLSPSLENYYSKYFKNRQMIAAWSEEDTAFIKSKEKALSSQKAEIDADENRLSGYEAQMKVYQRTGNIAAYNSLVTPHNNLVAKIRNEITVYNQNVTSYNDMIASISSNSFSVYDLQGIGQ